MLETVVLVFGVIALGFLARHFGLLPKGAYRPINDYVYYVSMPLLIFVKLADTPLGAQQLSLAAASALPILACMGIVAILWKLRACSPKTCASLLLASFFGNIVYMGFPVLQMRFGEGAIADGAIISFVYNIILFTLGFALLGLMLSRRLDGYALQKLARNTVIWACVAGAFFSLLSIKAPALLTGVLSSVGATTAPLALFSVGLFLHGRKLGGRPLHVAAMCALKLLLFPALFVASALLLGLSGRQFEISLLEAMMPLAVTNFVIAEKFGLDKGQMAEAVLASTLLSMPLLLGFDWLLAALPH